MNVITGQLVVLTVLLPLMILMKLEQNCCAFHTGIDARGFFNFEKLRASGSVRIIAAGVCDFTIALYADF